MNDRELLEFLVKSLSQLGGKVAAMEATIHGVLTIAQLNDEARAGVALRLEQAYATHLQASTNVAFLEAFEEAAGFIRAQLNRS